MEPLEGQMFLFRGGAHQPPAAEPVPEEGSSEEAERDPLPRGTGDILPPPQRHIQRPPPPPKPPRPREPETAELFPLPPPPPKQRLDLPFSRRMSDLVRRLQLLERDAKAPLELTLPQAHALHALRSAGSLRMQELAVSLGLAQSTVTRLVAPLKRMALLDRRPDRKDGRATRAYLTEEGITMADRVETVDRDLYQRIVERLPPTRRAEVVAAVELLHDVVLELAQSVVADDDDE